MGTSITPLEITDPRLARFYDYWLARKADRLFPARRDIDPLNFPYLLRLMLVDVLHDRLRFRVRLHGSEMASRAGYDLTGKFLDELPIPGYRNYVVAKCKALVEAGEPRVVRHNRVLDDRPWCYEALWLPFSDDGQAVTMLACGLIYDHDREFGGLSAAAAGRAA